MLTAIDLIHYVQIYKMRNVCVFFFLQKHNKNSIFSKCSIIKSIQKQKTV